MDEIHLKYRLKRYLKALQEVDEGFKCHIFGAAEWRFEETEKKENDNYV